MKTKTFDCVEMKRRGSLRIYEQTKDLTFEQKVEYWCRRNAAMREEQDRLLHGAQTKNGNGPDA